MATVEEILAKAAKLDASGDKATANKLRAHVAAMNNAAAPKYSVADIEAKAAKLEAAGDAETAAKLRAKAASMKPAVQPGERQSGAPKGPDKQAAVENAMQPPRADAPRDEYADFAAFEAANPALAGKYKPDNFPPPGAVIGTGGGGGRSGGGGAGYTVKARADNGTFGDTAAAMVEGPLAAAGQFSAGFTGNGESPSRDFLANDPLTRGLPDAILTGLGKVGDAGGAALSVVGAGMSGAAGLGAELMPGQDAAGELALAEDLTGMAQFAVPELAGVSSVPARMASGASKVAPVARVVPRLAEDVAAAKRLGIPVMRSDVRPPQTAIGKIAQRAGEGIPVAGTGGMRAKQATARLDAVKSFVSEFVGDTILPAIDDVTAALLEKRGSDLKRHTGAKAEVVEKIKGQGAVPVPKAVAEIDAQIAALEAQRLGELRPVIDKLRDFKRSLLDQPLDVIEKNRKAVGSAFADPGLASIRGTGEKALSAVYAPLRDDIAEFVKSKGGAGDLAKWKSANAQLSSMAGDLKDTALKRVLTKGDETPEAVRAMLFSQKPSDVMRLYRSLPEKGKASARSAIVQEAVAKAGGVENLSPERFKNALGKLGHQVGAFFKGEDFEAADGLLKALRLTEQAAKAGAAPLTGVQNMPAAVTLLVSSFFGGSIPATAAALGGIGGIARIYEATGVRSALRKLSKTQNPKAQATIIKSLDAALKEAGIPSAQGAAQSANTDTPPLRRALP